MDSRFAPSDLTSPLVALNGAEVLTVAAVAAQAFGNHHARALDMLYHLGHLTTQLSRSRFNRRLHELAAWLPLLVQTIGACIAQVQAAIYDFVIDSLPMPVCRRVRERAYCRYCTAKEEQLFGWRSHHDKRL